MAVTCAKCGAEFDSQDQLHEHIREAHGAVPASGDFI